MSLFSKIGKVVGKVAKLTSFIPGPIGAVSRIAAVGATAAGAVGAATQVMRAGSVASRVLPGIGKLAPIARTVGRVGGRVAGAAATGAILYDAFGRPMKAHKGYKRINPMNYRAAKRAIRRIEMVKKMTDRIGKITIRKKDC